MANITVIAYTITDVQEAGTYEFRLYNSLPFTNASGLLIPADSPGGRFCYRKAACVYDAAAKTITVPQVVIDSTTDSLDNQGARYSHAGIYKGGKLIRTILEDFPVPTDLGSPLTWTVLKINRYAQRVFLDNGYYNKNQVNSLLNELIRLFGGEFEVPFTVALLTPTANQDISGTFFLTASVVNYGAVATIVEVEYFAGATSLGLSANQGSNFYVVGNTADSGLADGLHQIRARLKDSDGNFFTSPPVTVSVNVVGFQPLDTTLTQLSAITPEHKDFLQFLDGVLVNVTAADVKGSLLLSNVNNTSDAEKPVSNPQALALAGKADLVDGKVPLSTLETINQGEFIGKATSGLGSPETLQMGEEFQLAEGSFNLAENTVALNKLVTIPTFRLLGRVSPLTGNAEPIPLNSEHFVYDPGTGLGINPLASGLTTEQVQDIVAAMMTAGTNSSWIYDDVAGTLRVDAPQLTNEEVQDKIGALLSGGANTTVTYNDGANTLTIAETTAGKTQEEIEDIIAALLSQGANVTLTYNDAGNVLTVAASSGGGDATSIQTKSVPSLAIASIGDDFEAATFNSNDEWQVVNKNTINTVIRSGVPLTGISQSGGLLSSTNTAGTEYYIKSKKVAKFTDGSFVTFRGLTQTFSNETKFGLINAFQGANFFNVAFWLMHPNRVAQWIHSNVVTPTDTGTTINPFSPQSDREYFRIRAAGTSVIFDTSPDNATWTTRHTIANSTLINSYVSVAMQVGNESWTLKEVSTNMRDALLLYRKKSDAFEVVNFYELKDALNNIAV